MDAAVIGPASAMKYAPTISCRGKGVVSTSRRLWNCCGCRDAITRDVYQHHGHRRLASVTVRQALASAKQLSVCTALCTVLLGA